MLRRCIAEFGAKNWSQIALHIRGRSGKSCRLRWARRGGAALLAGRPPLGGSSCCRPPERQPLARARVLRSCELLAPLAVSVPAPTSRSPAPPTSVGHPPHPPHPTPRHATAHPRWCNQLNPEVKKDPFSQWEDAVIILSHRIHGNKWASESAGWVSAVACGDALGGSVWWRWRGPQREGARVVLLKPYITLIACEGIVWSSRSSTAIWQGTACSRCAASQCGPHPLAACSHCQAAAGPHRQCREEPLELHAKAQVHRCALLGTALRSFSTQVCAPVLVATWRGRVPLVHVLRYVLCVPTALTLSLPSHPASPPPPAGQLNNRYLKQRVDLQWLLENEPDVDEPYDDMPSVSICISHCCYVQSFEGTLSSVPMPCIQ